MSKRHRPTTLFIMSTSKDKYYSPTAECVHGFFKMTELNSLLSPAAQKKVTRFKQRKGDLSFREFIRLAGETINRPETDCIVLQFMFTELATVFDVYRLQVFHTIAWGTPHNIWRSLLKQHLTSLLAYAAFRTAVYSITIKTNSTILPKDPEWFIPQKGNSCAGSTLLWWINTAGLTWDTFCDKVQDSATERTLKSWLSGKIPRRSTLIKIHKTNLDLGEREADLKRSFLITMTIACGVSNFLDTIQYTLGSQACSEFIQDFTKTYTHLFDSIYARCKPAIDQTRQLPCLEAKDAISQLIEKEVQSASRFDPIIKKILYGEKIEHDIDLSQFEIISDLYNKALQNLPPTASNTAEATIHIEALKAAPAWGKFKDFAIPFLEGLNNIGQHDNEAAARSFYKAYLEARFQACFLMEGILEDALSSACYVFSQRAGHNQQRENLWSDICGMVSWAKWHGMCAELTNVADDDGSEIGHSLSNEDYQRRILENGRRFFEKRFKDWLPNEDTFFEVSPHLAIGLGNPDSQSPYKGHKNTLYRNDTRDNSMLMNAIYRHNFAKAMKLIKDGADLNFRNTTEDNAFYYAMDQDYWPHKLPVAEAILRREKSPIEALTLETPSRRLRTTSLRLVLTNRNPHLLELILARGVNINKRFSSEFGDISPLYFAILACARDIEDRPTIKCLDESYGSDDNAQRIVEILIENGADIHALHRGGMTPLTQAVALDLTSVAKMLVKTGANCDTVLEDGTFIFNLCSSTAMEKILKDGVLNGQSSMIIGG